MSGSVIGKHFTVSTWGESHGAALGVVIDGCPAGLSLCEADIQPYMDRRKPGQSDYTTKRREADDIRILSGVFEGKTTGTPISLILYNEDHRSADYSVLADAYRPGHADLAYDQKYGFRDYRGGGRSSGRETAARVASGAVAGKLLKEFGISCRAYTRSIGPVSITSYDEEERLKNSLYMPDASACEKAEAYLKEVMAKKDSAGGVIECVISGCPKGLGEPVFDKLSADLAKAVCSIGAVKGFEIGDGFASADTLGSKNNDPLFFKEGGIHTASNHAGGIYGGIANGADILFRAAIKPTPSISQTQDTVTRDGKPIKLEIPGRHDPVIVPRAVVVVESMACLVIADHLIGNMSSRLEGMLAFYHCQP
ncbi:MAG: chorismate synthase [Lachnospiraceae bacterium]|nr:chorismate synthase [Lachnospiraceae bacterium]